MTGRVLARTTLTLGALVALGFALVVLLHSFSVTQPPVIATRAPVIPAQTSRAVVRTTPTPALPAAPKPAGPAPAPESSAADVVGHAKGSIHFEKEAEQGSGRRESIDINVRSALGVWQPDGRVMRVLLLEAPPAADSVDGMLVAIQSGQTNAIANRSAVLELRFIPTAQAFDRNELDSATLIVRDGANTSSADALSSLDWRGSLPWPNPNLLSRQHSSFTLNSSNETLASDREIWKQSWRLTLTVPVIMR